MSPTSKAAASPELLRTMDAYWRAANYLTVGQIYLQENALLREPLRPEHIKPRLLGHWGTSPGLSFVYVHVNRLIRDADANVIYLAGPGHGGPAIARQRLSRGDLLGDLSGRLPRPRGASPAFPPVLDPRRRPEPRQRPDPWLDPRRRRAGLRARARLRRRARQPGPHRGGRRRGWRSRDGTARGLLEERRLPRIPSATARCCRSST